MANRTPWFTPHITPAIKGQITRAIKTYRANMADITVDTCLNFAFGAPRSIRQAVVSVLMDKCDMPREQAKHLARKYLASQVKATT